jgi:predicted Zn finger-like uncharacterized protein
MSMVTTCPHCATSFNVAPEVLLSRNGRVRCGKCKQVFDGLLSATTLDEYQATAGIAAGGMADDATPDVYWPALPDVPDVPVPPIPLEIAAAASPEYLPDASAVDVSPVFIASSSTEPLPGSARDTKVARDDSDLAFEEFEPEQKPLHRGWAIAATVAALLLAGQVLYRYRSEIAANFPVTKSALTQICAWTGCTVPPLQQPASLNIEASDLQVVDKAQPHLVQLTATLRNRAAIDIGYPAFDLVLTDNREHALARRVIVPTDYLPGTNAAQSTIAANAEVTVRVDMDLSGLPAAGFRLNLTPAPSN